MTSSYIPAPGGGGAGSPHGNTLPTVTTVADTYVARNSESGTVSLGGAGGKISYSSNDSVLAEGGAGGDLGLAGEDRVTGGLATSLVTGGAAGDAFHFDGGTLTIDPSSRGDIFPPIP